MQYYFKALVVVGLFTSLVASAECKRDVTQYVKDGKVITKGQENFSIVEAFKNRGGVDANSDPFFCFEAAMSSTALQAISGEDKNLMPGEKEKILATLVAYASAAEKISKSYHPNTLDRVKVTIVDSVSNEDSAKAGNNISCGDGADADRVRCFNIKSGMSEADIMALFTNPDDGYFIKNGWIDKGNGAIAYGVQVDPDVGRKVDSALGNTGFAHTTADGNHISTTGAVNVNN
jgi:hypothetical protein